MTEDHINKPHVYDHISRMFTLRLRKQYPMTAESRSFLDSTTKLNAFLIKAAVCKNYVLITQSFMFHFEIVEGVKSKVSATVTLI